MTLKLLNQPEYLDIEIIRVTNDPSLYQKVDKIVNDKRKKRIFPLELAGVLGKIENNKIAESAKGDPKKIFEIYKGIAEELNDSENIIEDKIDMVKKGWFDEATRNKLIKYGKETREE